MPHSKGLFYEFDCYRLDVGRRILVRTGEAVSLTPKATEILIMLVSRAGDLVEKDEMISQVWPDSFVEEANVSQNIFTLRRALGDERIFPRFIETVAKRGYRFIAPVQTIQSEPVAVVEAVESSGPPTLAVLPLVNTTKDPAVEYLVDGLTDNIINNLCGLSTLHVMSRSAVVRYKGREVDLKQTGRELGVDAIMLGKIDSRKSGMVIQIELVDVKNGWQLWGETFDCSQSDILEIEERLLKQLLGKLNLKLTGDQEKRITARYTESGEAYQSYLEGRYHWSQYTRKGIETAIGHFRCAIEMDANYALAYAGIVDCYLRLATNYLPPEDDSATEVGREAQVDPAPQVDEVGSADDPDAKEEMFDSRVKEVFDSRVKLRHEWDWKGAERELRRASELKAEYPSAHQWYAAYLFARHLFEESEYFKVEVEASQSSPFEASRSISKPTQIASLDLTKTEQVQVFVLLPENSLKSEIMKPRT
jgi:DNA-binding winged helix-turn-helix (wHTH) protein